MIYFRDILEVQNVYRDFQLPQHKASEQPYSELKKKDLDVNTH